MTTFDSTKASLSDLLREIKEGKIQLPDFQRGWVWDDDHIRDLLVSIARSFPIGAVMLLEAGGEVRFETRPVEGLEDLVPKGQVPEKLILDGQQRLTTLTQALSLNAPVQTRTAKGKRIQRHYYFDIRKAVEAPHALEEAIVAVDENRQLRSNFGRDIELDLSTTELSANSSTSRAVKSLDRMTGRPPCIALLPSTSPSTWHFGVKCWRRSVATSYR